MITEAINIFDLGYNRDLYKEDRFYDPPSIMESNMNSTNPIIIGSGGLGSNLTMNAGYMESVGFVTGSKGWRIDADGNAEFATGTFRGSITASTIDIGGLDNTSFHVDINGNSWWGAATFAAAPAKISNAGAATFTALTITGYIPTGGAADDVNAGAVTINASKINISGFTTFASGYDPTTKTKAVGGTYDSASSGPRVRIFPDSSTGIQVIDDVAATVFQVNVGGTNVGDVTIGNYAGDQGCLWDKSAGTFNVKGNITANAVAASISITTPTITGGTIQTASSGERIVLNSSGKSIDFYNGTDANPSSFVAGSGVNAYIKCTKDLGSDQNISVAAGYWLKWGGMNGLSIPAAPADTSTIYSEKNISPNDDSSSYNLGSSGAKWHYLYVRHAVIYGDSASAATFTMNGTQLTLDRDLIPGTADSFTIGSSTYRWNDGRFKELNIYGSSTSNCVRLYGDGSTLTVDNHFAPSADNSKQCGTVTNRWSDLRSVKINGADVGFANGWKLREYPAKAEDIGNSEEWMKKNANLGIQLLDDQDNMVAVFHKDGYVYCRGIKQIKELQ